MALARSASSIWRDYVTDGVSASGIHHPRKSEIREWGAALEQSLDGNLDIGFVTPSMYSDGGDTFANTQLESAAAAAITNNAYLDLQGREWVVGRSGVALPPKLKNGRIRIDVSATRTVAELANAAVLCGVQVACGDMFAAGYAKTTVTADLAKGAVTIPVASSAGFAPGDYVLIHKDTGWASATSGGITSTYGKRSEPALVIGVPGPTSLRLAAGLMQSYTVASPAPTVRKYPAVDVHWSDVAIEGDPDQDDVFGAIVTNPRFAWFEDCRVEGVRRTGIGCFGGYRSGWWDCDAERVDQDGLGYPFQCNSTAITQFFGGHVARSRHAVVAGADMGESSPVVWWFEVDGLSVNGNTDGAVNAHAGVAYGRISNVSGTFDPTGVDPSATVDGLTDGDAVLWTGGELSVESCHFLGFRRHGISCVQSVPSDGSIRLGLTVDRVKLVTTSAPTVGGVAQGSYGIVYDPSLMSHATAAVTAGKVALRDSESCTQSGVYVNVGSIATNQVLADGNVFESFGTGALTSPAMSIVNTGSAANTAKSLRVTSNSFKMPASASVDCVVVQGRSAARLADVLFLGNVTDGGRYGVAGFEADVTHGQSVRVNSDVALPAGLGAVTNGTFSPFGGLGGTTGSTANALLRANGTGGGTVKASPVVADDAGSLTGVGGIAANGNTVVTATGSGFSANNSANAADGVALLPIGVLHAARTSTQTKFVLQTLSQTVSSYQMSMLWGSTLVGSITSTASATAFNTSSDYRLKNEVGPLDSALEIIEALRPIKFTFKADPLAEIQAGFIAHEVQATAPWAVHGVKDAVEKDDDGNDIIVPQQLDHSKLVPVLVAAVKEMAERLAALENGGQ